MEEEKIVSIEDRIPKLKEARRKKANRTLLSYLTLFFVLIAIIVYLQSPFSDIKTIEVKGNAMIPDAQIVEYSRLEAGSNIWRVYPKDVAKKISQHPLIKNVHVERKLPQTISIEVEERRVIGYVKSGQQYLPITEEGTIVKNIEFEMLNHVPFFVNFSDEEYLTRLAEEMKEIPDYILKLISEIHWKPTDKNKYKIVLYMNDGYIVNASIRDLASKINSYPSIIAQLDEKQKAIIHMDVGVYVEMLK